MKDNATDYMFFLQKELGLNRNSQEYENALAQFKIDYWDGSFYKDFLDYLGEK